MIQGKPVFSKIAAAERPKRSSLDIVLFKQHSDDVLLSIKWII